MPKKEVPIHFLNQYLPPGTSDAVMTYLQAHKIHLTIAKERKSILGDYRHKTNAENHRISVNGNLNRYAFLITLLHEIGHLLTFEQYGNRVQSHGKEWKMIYGQLLHQFIVNNIFPGDIAKELLVSLKNPAASSCAEDGLLRVLRRYDTRQDNFFLIEELAAGAKFRIKDGRVFKKEERLRKRFKCREEATGRYYLFSPVYEVEMLLPES